MKIIYSKINGVIGTIGNYTENETHFIQQDTYFDKVSFDVIDEINAPDYFNITGYIVKNQELVKIGD